MKYIINFDKFLNEKKKSKDIKGTVDEYGWIDENPLPNVSAKDQEKANNDWVRRMRRNHYPMFYDKNGDLKPQYKKAIKENILKEGKKLWDMRNEIIELSKRDDEIGTIAKFCLALHDDSNASSFINIKGGGGRND